LKNVGGFSKKIWVELSMGTRNSLLDCVSDLDQGSRSNLMFLVVFKILIRATTMCMIYVIIMYCYGRPM